MSLTPSKMCRFCWLAANKYVSHNNDMKIDKRQKDWKQELRVLPFHSRAVEVVQYEKLHLVAYASMKIANLFVDQRATNNMSSHSLHRKAAHSVTIL